MPSKKPSKEELEEYLRRRIEELREELRYLEAILSSLSGEASGEVEEIPPSEVKVITANGNVLANVIESSNYTKIIFTEGFPKSNPYVKSFLLKMLEDKQATGLIESFRVGEKRDYITEIEIHGKMDSKLFKELELALKFVWKNIREQE